MLENRVTVNYLRVRCGESRETVKKNLPIARIVVTGLLALTISFAVPQTLHRRDLDHAYFVYQRNPTPENEKRLRDEQAKHDRIWAAILVVETVVIFTALNIGWLIGRRIVRPRTGLPSTT